METSEATKIIIAVLQLTAKATSLGYGYICYIKRVPKAVRELLDELALLGKAIDGLQERLDEILPFVKLQKIGGPNGPPPGCVRDLEALVSKLETKDVSETNSELQWPCGEEETAQWILQIRRYRMLYMFPSTADQISLLEEIEVHAQKINPAVQEIKFDIHGQTIFLAVGAKPTGIDWGNMADLDTQKTGLNIPSIPSELVQSTSDGTNIIDQEAAKRRMALDQLYLDAFDTRHIEISNARQKGTGEWFLESPEVREWVRKNPNSPILWGYGVPGVGKSFLSSLLIDCLRDQATDANFGVAYIYFDHKEQVRQKPRNILASLVKQLIGQLTRPVDRIEDLYEKLSPESVRLSLVDLCSALLSTLKAFDQVFLVFDALDECDEKKQRKYLLQFFHRMGNSGIHVFITSRHCPGDIQTSLCDSAKLELSAKEEDIRQYIEQKIDENPRAQRLINQGKCKDNIISELTSCANGVFLLVHFHIEFLCQQPTTRRIMKELEEIKNSSPSKDPLDTVYSRAMKTIHTQASSSVQLAMKILSWLAKARRTLTTDELREAVFVEPEVYELDEWDLPDKATMLDVCAGLVTMDEQTNTIRFFHSTVQEYLLRNSQIPQDAGANVAIACITYLSFHVFSKPIPHSLKDKRDTESYPGIYHRINQHPFLYYASHYFPFHLDECGETLSIEPLLRLLTHPGNLSSYIQAQDYDYPSTWTNFQHQKESPLHTASALGHRAIVELLLDKGASIEGLDKHGLLALHSAAMTEKEAVVQLLLDRGSNTETRNKYGATALHWAASTGSETILQFLLDRGANIGARNKNGNTALHLAATVGNDTALQLLLERGADVEAQNDNGDTALHSAARQGQETAVRLLLDRGADIEAQNYDWIRALHLAAIMGREVVVELLLNEGAEMEAQQKTGCTALHYASGEVVQLLLKRGANIGARNRDGNTVLHFAMLEGKSAVIQLLLDNGADIEAWNKCGDAAIHYAARLGRETVIQQLLDRGANIEAQENGSTALLCAVEKGREAVVKLLLDRGADIEAGDGSGYTALHLAILIGKEGIIQLLLDRGADIEAQDENGDTTLHCAARAGKEMIVRQLLDNGANIEARNNKGSTVLHRAVELGQEIVIRLLLDKGARIEAVDDAGLGSLHKAVKAEIEPVIQLLLDRGVDIEAQIDDGRTGQSVVIRYRVKVKDSADIISRSKFGMTALHLAARNGKEVSTRLLLARGANIEAWSKGRMTALHLAAEAGEETVIQLLLDKGASIEAWNEDRMRALLWAAEIGQETVVSILLERGADIEARDGNGLAALHIAAKMGHYMVVQLLINSGANVEARTNDGSTALQVAAKTGEKEVVRLLLEKATQIKTKVEA